MVVKHLIEGHAKLEEFIKTLDKKESVVLLFTGAATDTAASWCPDCVAAEPIVDAALKEVEDRSFHFGQVVVGSRDQWKDPKCPFRTDPRLKLTSVPTLMLWGTPNRLNDVECQSIDNVRMVLEDV